MSKPAELDLLPLQEVTDPELRASLERLARTMAKDERTNAQPAPEKLPAKVIQLPLWPEAQRGAPNDILRSALFAAIQGRGREYIKQQIIAAYNGVRIKYTGQQLDQSDLDVWEQILHLAREHPLGNICQFTANSFLKALGRSNGKAQYEWLESVIVRLTACLVEVSKDKQLYGRGLIIRYDIDQKTRVYKIAVDADMKEVYSAGWSGVDWEQRQQLRGKPLALWLHGYYSTHAAPLLVKVDTLRQLSGSRAKTLRSFRQKLGLALDELKTIGALEAWKIDEGDLVQADRGKAISDSQRRHLSRPKARKSHKK